MLSHYNEPFFLVKHALIDGMNVHVNGEFDFYTKYLLISWLNIIRRQIVSRVVTMNMVLLLALVYLCNGLSLNVQDVMN